MPNLSNLVEQYYALRQGCTNPERQITVATKFCTVASRYGILFMSLFWSVEFLSRL